LVGRENLHEKLRFDPSNVVNGLPTWNPNEGTEGDDENEEQIEENDQQAPSNPYLDGSKKQDAFDPNAGPVTNEDDEAEAGEEERLLNIVSLVYVAVFINHYATTGPLATRSFPTIFESVPTSGERPTLRTRRRLLALLAWTRTSPETKACRPASITIIVPPSCK
jgi:hypothetical protein